MNHRKNVPYECSTDIILLRIRPIRPRIDGFSFLDNLLIGIALRQACPIAIKEISDRGAYLVARLFLRSPFIDLGFLAKQDRMELDGNLLDPVDIFLSKSFFLRISKSACASSSSPSRIAR